MKRAWVLIPLLLFLLAWYTYEAGWFSNKVEAPPNVYVSDKTDAPWFEVQIKLSSEARETLRKKGETIVIAAYFFGIPKPDSKYPPSSDGNISVGETRHELPSEGVHRFDLSTVSKERVSDLVNPDYIVLVNVFSGRKSDQNNLLDCGIIHDPISMVQNKRHVVNCKLIGER